MKKIFILILTVLFLVSACKKNLLESIFVPEPEEIKKGDEYKNPHI